jgi:hypothetical protein
MQEESTRKRAHKQLLLAAIGVATVSFVGAQSGCAASTDQSDEDDAPYDDEEEQADAPVGSTQQALTDQALAQPALSDNLSTDILVRDRNLELARWRWPIPVGNLMVVPVDRFDVTIQQQQLANRAIVK